MTHKGKHMYKRGHQRIVCKNKARSADNIQSLVKSNTVWTEGKALKAYIKADSLCWASLHHGNELFNADPLSAFHMLFRWMQIGRVHQASEHGLEVGMVGVRSVHSKFHIVRLPIDPAPICIQQNRVWTVEEDQQCNVSLCAADSLNLSVRLYIFAHIEL